MKVTSLVTSKQVSGMVIPLYIMILLLNAYLICILVRKKRLYYAFIDYKKPLTVSIELIFGISYLLTRPTASFLLLLSICTRMQNRALLSGKNPL